MQHVKSCFTSLSIWMPEWWKCVSHWFHEQEISLGMICIKKSLWHALHIKNVSMQNVTLCHLHLQQQKNLKLWWFFEKDGGKWTSSQKQGIQYRKKPKSLGFHLGNFRRLGSLHPTVADALVKELVIALAIYNCIFIVGTHHQLLDVCLCDLHTLFNFLIWKGGSGRKI